METRLTGLDGLRSDKGTRARVVAAYVPIVLVAVVGWFIVLRNAHSFPSALALAGVCFVLGLRHAMDVDHIAAIDNVTRKLVNDGRRSVGVGFFFSLGHSFAVLVMAVSLVVAEVYLKKNLMRYSDRIDMIGSSICALVLYLLAFMNVPVLFGILKTYKDVAAGRTTESAEIEKEMQQKGFMNRYFKWIYRSIHSSWQMFPVGVLFGLGFDTATEMVVLASTATAASSQTLPLWLAFVCLMLFFAAMMFLDTTDSIAMLYAYSWAFSDFKRKILYNLSMTAVSMLIAFVIGTVEWLQVLSMALGLKSGLWDRLNSLDLTHLGIGAALSFMVLWVVAMLAYRGAKPDDGDQNRSVGESLEVGLP